MTASPLHAADCPCRPKRDHYAGRGYERPRPAALSRFEHQHTERGAFRAICNGEGFRVRATGIAILKTVRTKSSLQVQSPALLFQSAALPADTGALSRFVLPAVRLRCKFLPALTASGSRLSLRVNSVQEPTRGLSKCFRVLLSALFHVSKETHGASEWNEKVFPNSTKVLVKVT